MKNTDKNIKILMMDFSGIYEDQQFWRGKEVSRVEARDIPGTNCYCDEDAMNAIRSRIALILPEESILLIPETITI